MNSKEFTLGSQALKEQVFFSLKASAEFLTILTQTENAFIEFISPTICTVTVGSQVFHITLSDVLTTDVYTLQNSSTMNEELAYVGSCVNRGKVVGAVADAGIERHKTVETSKKRSISFLSGDVHTVSHSEPNPKRLTTTSAKSVHKVSASSKVQRGVLPAIEPPVASTQWVMLPSVSARATAKDIASFFSGLSIRQIRVPLCGIALDSRDNDRINVFVEFAQKHGAELSVLRSGEALRWIKSLPDGSKTASVERQEVRHVTQVSHVPWISAVAVPLISDSNVSIESRLRTVANVLTADSCCLDMDPSVLGPRWADVLRSVGMVAGSPLALTERTSKKSRCKGSESAMRDLAGSKYLVDSAAAEDVFRECCGYDGWGSDEENEEEWGEDGCWLGGLLLSSDASDTLPCNARRQQAGRDLCEVNAVLRDLFATHSRLLLDALNHVPGGRKAITGSTAELTRQCIDHVGSAMQLFRAVRSELWRQAHCHVHYIERAQQG